MKDGGWAERGKMNDGGCGSNSGDVLGSLFFVKGTAAQKQRERYSQVAGDSTRWQKMHFQVSGLGRQVPGSGVQHQVQVRGPYLYPNPHPKSRT